jgi:hypothetical protein
MGSEPDEVDPKKIAEGAIVRLKVQVLDQKIEELYRRLRAAEAHGQPIAAYQQEMLALQKEKFALRGTPLS